MEIVKNYKEIKSGVTQHFYYQPLFFGSVASSEIYELCENKTITSLEVSIMRYLLTFRLAAFSQIKRDFLADMSADEVEKEKAKLLTLVKKRVLNVFALTDEGINKAKEMPKNGELFFTLDYGALSVLRSLINDETLDDWKASDALMPALKVKKTCMLIDLYARLKKESILNFFVGKKTYSSNKIRFAPKSTFAVRGKVFLAETLTEEDTFIGEDTNLFEKLIKYESFLKGDTWGSFFVDQEEAPILIILCDDMSYVEKFANRVDELSIPYVYYLCLQDDKPLYKSFYAHQKGKMVPVEIALLGGE